MLGLVPLFTVAFIYVARYPLFERWLSALERFLVRHLLPGSGPAIRPYLDEFTTKAANLQGIGILIVVITGGAARGDRREGDQCDLGTHPPRSWSAASPSIARRDARTARDRRPPSIRRNWLLETSLTVELVTSPRPRARDADRRCARHLFFALLYAVLPSRRVPWRSALPAASWPRSRSRAKRGFVLFVSNVPTYQRVYGAVAVLPLFLVWIFVSWIVVLSARP